MLAAVNMKTVGCQVIEEALAWVKFSELGSPMVVSQKGLPLSREKLHDNCEIVHLLQKLHPSGFL